MLQRAHDQERHPRRRDEAQRAHPLPGRRRGGPGGADLRLRLPKQSPQERLEASWVGRSVISAFLLVTLGFVLVTNLPDSQTKQSLNRIGSPYLNALGLDQNWGAFAPDPRRTSLDLVARITYDDGSTSVWHYPQSNPLYGEYWDYRWRKWLEWMVVISREDLRLPLASWLARREAAAGRRPLRVVLIARWRDIPRPPFESLAAQPATSRWRQKQFFSVWVTPALLGEVTVG